MPMRQVQYGGNYNHQHHNPYLNTFNPRWQHHPKLSWETNQNAPQPSHEKKPTLEEAMIELAKSQAELGKSQAELAKS